MTALDIFVLLLMGSGAIFGFLRGLVQEVLSLCVWLLIIVAVRFLHPTATDFLAGPVGNEGGASVLAFAAILIVVYALGRSVARAVGQKSRKSLLGPVDRVLGFGFGMIKGLIVATLFYLLVTLIYDSIYGPDESRPDWLAESRTYPLLNASGTAMVDLVEQQRASQDEAE